MKIHVMNSHCLVGEIGKTMLVVVAPISGVAFHGVLALGICWVLLLHGAMLDVAVNFQGLTFQEKLISTKTKVPNTWFSNSY